MTLRWPIHVLAPTSGGVPRLAPRNLRSAASVAGRSQVSSSNAGIWTMTLGGIAIRNENQRKVWNALEILLEGILNPVLVPMCRGDQPYTSAADYVTVPHDDLMPFDDDTEYVGTVIDVTSGGAAIGATSMTVTINSAGTLIPGNGFSFGDGEFHKIRTIDGTAMTFRPPLRATLLAGTSLEFDDPVCRMRLASDREMSVDLDLRRFGSPTVNLIEDN